MTDPIILPPEGFEPTAIAPTVMAAKVLPVAIVEAGAYQVPVKRYENIVLTCPNLRCPKQQFAASFDEVVRLIPCPTCDTPTEIPPSMRGMP